MFLDQKSLTERYMQDLQYLEIKHYTSKLPIVKQKITGKLENTLN